MSYLAPEAWRENSAYLYGVDLYNNAYWWESHEAWESVWHTTRKDDVYGQFLQGLIQISAAFIKWHLHQHEGLRRLYTIGMGRLESVCKTHTEFMGMNLHKHLKKLQVHFSKVLADQTVWPDPLENYPFIELVV